MARAQSLARSSRLRCGKPTTPMQPPSHRIRSSASVTRSLAPSKFSPVTLLVRTSPFNGVTGTFRTDYDGRYSRFRQFSADAGWEEATRVAAGGLEQRALPPRRAGKQRVRPSQYFNSSTNLRFQQNRYGFIHQLNWDVKTQSLLQHRIASYYNAQCCGFSAEYQFIDLHLPLLGRRAAGLAVSLFGDARRHRKRVEHLRRARRH